jgi:hypothetical protein
MKAGKFFRSHKYNRKLEGLRSRHVLVALCSGHHVPYPRFWVIMNYVRLTLSIFYYKDITLVARLMSLSVARQQLGSGFDNITCAAELRFSKRRGPVVSIYASYSGGPGTQFECRPTNRGIPWYYSFPPGICQGRALNYFTSAHFQFIIIFLCSVSQAQNSFWARAVRILVLPAAIRTVLDND